jgi:hypothetical protein
MSGAPDFGRIFRWSVLMLAVGALAGFVWWWLAEPAEWEVTAQGITLTEDAVRSQFGAVVTFVIIGAAVCTAWALLAGHILRDLGWPLVPVFAVVATVASLVAWQVGVALGPSDDPRDISEDPARVAALSIGDRLPAPLEIDAVAPFLMWPIFALAGLLAAAWLDRSDHE